MGPSPGSPRDTPKNVPAGWRPVGRRTPTTPSLGRKLPRGLLLQVTPPAKGPTLHKGQGIPT